MEFMSKWLTELKKIIFIQGDSVQLQDIFKEINKNESTFREDYETISGRIQDLKIFSKAQSSSSQYLEGLLKIKFIDKLLYDRPCCVITAYKEQDIQKFQEDQFYLKEVSKYKTIKLIILIEMTKECQEKELEFKKLLEVETKSIMFYHSIINSKKLIKLIEENIKSYYTDLSKRKKKRLKQSTDPVNIQTNLRITIQLIFYYEIQKKHQKSNDQLINSRNNILQLIHFFNQQIKAQITDQDSLFQNLHLILKLQELRSILDLLFFKKFKKQDSRQMNNYIISHYQQFKKIFAIKSYFIDFFDIQWRYFFFLRVDEMIGSQNPFKHYIFYYFNKYSEVLQELQQKIEYNAESKLESMTIFFQKKYYGRYDLLTKYANNNILEKSSLEMIILRQKYMMQHIFNYQDLQKLKEKNLVIVQELCKLEKDSVLLNYMLYQQKEDNEQFWKIVELLISKKQNNCLLDIFNKKVERESDEQQLVKLQYYRHLFDIKILQENVKKLNQQSVCRLEDGLKISLGQKQIMVEVTYKQQRYQLNDVLKYQIEIRYRNKQVKDLFNQLEIKYNNSYYDSKINLNDCEQQQKLKDSLMIDCELKDRTQVHLNIQEILLSKDTQNIDLSIKNIKYKTTNHILIDQQRLFQIDCFFYKHIVINEKVELKVRVKQFVKVDLEQIELQSIDNMVVYDKKIIDDDIIHTVVFQKEGGYKLFINHLNKIVKQINIDIKQNFKAIVRNRTLYLENQLVDSKVHKIIMNELQSYEEHLVDDLVYKGDVYQIYLSSTAIPAHIQIEWTRKDNQQMNISEIDVDQIKEEQENRLKVDYEYLGIQKMGSIVDYKVNIKNVSEAGLKIMVRLNQDQKQTFVIGGQMQKLVELMPGSIYTMKLVLVPTQIGLQTLPQINVLQYSEQWNLIHYVQKNIFIQP